MVDKKAKYESVLMMDTDERRKYAADEREKEREKERAKAEGRKQ